MSGASQALLDTVQGGIADAASRYVGDKITDPMRHAIKAYVVTFLRGMMADGSIPDDVNLDFVKVTHERSTIRVELPSLLKLYLGEGFDSPRVRRFDHDCDRCVFLAHGLEHDLYFCPIDVVRSTVIARSSSEPSDYQSGIPVARGLPDSEPLGLAYRLAQEKGLLAG